MPTPPLMQAVNSLRVGLQGTAGVTVTYTYISGSTIDVTAIPGRTDTQVDAGDGTIRSERSHDFIIDINDMPSEPVAGDRVSWDGRDYEVMNITGGKHVEEVGPYMQVYRIHTKQVYGS